MGFLKLKPFFSSSSSKSKNEPKMDQKLQTEQTPTSFVSRMKIHLSRMKIHLSRMNIVYPVVGNNSIMSRKGHGTSTKAVQQNLRYKVDRENADLICSYNRHFAEQNGCFLRSDWSNKVNNTGSTKYFDSVTGKPLFEAPRGRSFNAFLKESKHHGWPSFRDEEVNWENVRCLLNGECVSVDGTHLGHNLPDKKGNRYCINLISVAGNPVDSK